MFGIGYVKLFWMVRLARKREQIDEEKNTKMAGLRASRQIVDMQRANDIPFGAKAIQQGVQVHGIWISDGRNPYPSTVVKIERPGSSSSESLLSIDSNTAHAGINQAPKLPPSRGRRQVRQSAPGLIAHGHPAGASDIEPSTPRHSLSRSSYQPRRSSQLRHGETQHDKETLELLEGRPAAKKRPQRSRHTTGLERKDLGYSTDAAAAADNERSSGDSDGTLSGPNHLKQSSNHRFLPINIKPTSSHSAPEAASNAIATDVELANQASLSKSKSYTSKDLGVSAESGLSLLPRSHSSIPTHVPFHANTATRKVNAGFEVLPAGTFGLPSRLGSESDVEAHRREGSHLGKLQKWRESLYMGKT